MNVLAITRSNTTTRIQHWLPACFLLLCALSFTSHATSVHQQPSSEVRWQSQVRSLIARQVTYPSLSRIEGTSGRTVVQLRLNRDGSINSLELVESAGSRDLDNAVISAIRRVRQFPPFPAEMADQVTAIFEIPFQFTIDPPSPTRPLTPPTSRPKVTSTSPAADEFAKFLQSLSKKERPQ